MMKTTKITATENGPFKIVNASKIENAKGTLLSQEEELWLCRCGGSKNKPFCDGTHNTNGFTGHSEAHEVSKTVEYKGKHIIIYDNRSICAKRGYCTRELPTVFQKNEKWINPDGDSVEKIIDICNRCPSGALSYALIGEEKCWGDIVPDTIVSLSEKRFGSHGPYDVKGDREISGQASRQPESPVKTTLCRCGCSKNKPFCSGEHYKIKFQDEKNE